MDITPTNYKEIDNRKFKIVDNIISYGDSELYFNTPNLKLVQILDINQSTYLKLKVLPRMNSNIFINNLLYFECGINNYVEDPKLLLNSHIVRDMLDNIYIKVKITDSLNNIFDKSKNQISHKSIEINKNVKPN